MDFNCQNSRVCALLMATSLLFINGCASKHIPKTQAVDVVGTSLTASAHEVSESLRLLAQLEAADTPQIKPTTAPKSGPLATKMSIVWHGPLEPLLKLVAKKIAYNFAVVGKRPAQEIIVLGNHTEATAFDIIEDLGWQAGKNVTILVDDDRKRIMVVYR